MSRSTLQMDETEYQEDTNNLEVDISDLPDAIDIATYSHSKHTLLIDNKEAMGSRFLRYQRGCYLQYHNKDHMTNESLRKNLIGALRYGSNFVLSFDNLPADDISHLFQDETFFPKTVMDRASVFKETTWGPMLREEADDPKQTHFLPLDNFKLIFVTKKDPVQSGIIDAVGKNMAIIRIRGIEDSNEHNKEGSDAIVAGMFGLKLVKRNSEAMCDGAFDGDLAIVQGELEKGFDLESTDKSGATPLSEAATQGQTAIVQYLIDLGADPNKQNDMGRSPLFRASFNGHLETVLLLLSVGGDPDLKTNEAEAPFMVAKTEEVRKILDDWDREEVKKLIVIRKQLIQKKMEERLTNAAEIDLHAREQIRNSLCDKAKNGDVEGMKSEIEELVMEAEREDAKRPRGSAQVRDERGQTLLMIAAQAGKLEMVTFLLEHWKSIEDDIFTGQPTLEKRAFRSNVNARDSKGWNPASVASFHGKKGCLLKILEHGGNPRVLNFYGKDSFAIVATEKDLLGAVLREGNSAILDTLEMWEADQQKSRILKGGTKDTSGTGTDPQKTLVAKALEEGVNDAGPIALQIEMEKEKATAVKKKSAAGGGVSAVKALKGKKKTGSAKKKKGKKKTK